MGGGGGNFLPNFSLLCLVGILEKITLPTPITCIARSCEQYFPPKVFVLPFSVGSLGIGAAAIYPNLPYCIVTFYSKSTKNCFMKKWKRFSLQYIIIKMIIEQVGINPIQYCRGHMLPTNFARFNLHCLVWQCWALQLCKHVLQMPRKLCCAYWGFWILVFIWFN